MSLPLSPAVWRQACVDTGMVQERRPLRLAVSDLSWQWPAEGLLRLTFTLRAGAYATAVIREIVNCEQA